MSQTVKHSVSFAFGNLKLAPGEQVIGLEVEVSGGGFESMSSLPKGWRISIDNKSVSRTTLNADLAFGSDTLDAGSLEQVVITLSQIEVEGQKFRVGGHLLVTNGASERRLSLSGQNFLPR